METNGCEKESVRIALYFPPFLSTKIFNEEYTEVS